MHTCYSHGCNTPFEMHAAATKKGLSLIGLSEHSPRPQGFDYKNEYRERLARHLPDYISQTKQIKKSLATAAGTTCAILVGMEMDWLEGQRDFTEKACRAYNFDYLIGSVHFLEHWGFDDGDELWIDASQEECNKRYENYFRAWKQMIRSGLFQIAAHPDLIKIYSVDKFHTWLQNAKSRDIVMDCLKDLRDYGMAMEISSAGLRKACAEIYPCAEIMEMAARLELPVSMASDAHNCMDVGFAFPQLADYAKYFGFRHQAVFNQGHMELFEF